ncbi:P-loop containing nucleoside triphosphate hydrolase protein [Gautieria morchelliformis]|nr:P-loop containing nucleoside triphosphate hydrolase protein [Gautieria morchelliformis]
MASNFSSVRFRDFAARGQISDQVLKGIPFEFCTLVQAATLDVVLQGTDVLARAKTGTGKTLAFLIPVIQQLASPSFRLPPLQHISALVLSPTRELAQQIEKEARILLQGSGLTSRLGVQCVVGGTNVNGDVRRMREARSDILVATPGRLIDLLENHGLNTKLGSVKFLVLDEADRLLDAGFKREIERIIQSLPNRAATPRQTLLFSATIPPDVHKIAQMALLPTHKHISTLSETDTATHAHVKQHALVVPPTEGFPALARLLAQWTRADPRAKIMVFSNTARATGITAQVFGELNPSLGVPLFTIHSRLSQPARTRATAGFTGAQSAVLFTSDVTARGIDVPGVTHVVQVGIPSSVEQYIHRLGRTARAGQTGTGLLILAPYEDFFLRSKGIKELNLEPWEDVAAAEPAYWRQRVEDAMDRVEKEPKEQAYQAWLGLYKGSLRDLGWTEQRLIDEAAAYAHDVLRYKGADAERRDGFVVESTGAANPPKWRPPPIMSKTVGKMGLKGGKVMGLNVVRELPGKEGVQRGRGKGGK